MHLGPVKTVSSCLVLPDLWSLVFSTTVGRSGATEKVNERQNQSEPGRSNGRSSCRSVQPHLTNVTLRPAPYEDDDDDEL